MIRICILVYTRYLYVHIVFCVPESYPGSVSLISSHDKTEKQISVDHYLRTFQSIQSQTFFILYLGTAALAVVQSIDSALNIFQDTQSEITG